MHAAEAFAFQGLELPAVSLVTFWNVSPPPSFGPVESTVRGLAFGYKQISLSYLSILDKIAQSMFFEVFTGLSLATMTVDK
jgi:hypothetical protein